MSADVIAQSIPQLLSSCPLSCTDTLYRPGSVFLVRDPTDPESNHSCSTCSSVIYSAPLQDNAKVTYSTMVLVHVWNKFRMCACACTYMYMYAQYMHTSAHMYIHNMLEVAKLQVCMSVSCTMYVTYIPKVQRSLYF